MQGLLFRVRGRWAHFKKPDTNNNPLTHDFQTKTALLGMMGAVLGIERRAMRPLFPQWSDDLLYGVQLRRAVRKESWSFTLRSLGGGQAPKPLEFLRDPDFLIALALKDPRSEAHFDEFGRFIEDSRACFTPVLGLHNCPAELQLLARGEWREASGEYSTRGFARRAHRFRGGVEQMARGRIGFERIPTYQNDDFWNLPDRYQEVIYPDAGGALLMEGEHFVFQSDSDSDNVAHNGAWDLI